MGDVDQLVRLPANEVRPWMPTVPSYLGFPEKRREDEVVPQARRR